MTADNPCRIIPRVDERRTKHVLSFVTLSLERSTRNVYNRWLNQERNLKSFCNEK